MFNKLTGIFSIALLFFGTILTGTVSAENAPPEKLLKDVLKLPLKKILAMKVTSVSKQEENLFDAAAAIYVITQEDLRRSGATSIPEALRMVPGLQVAQINSNIWAISSRGFNERFANKLLVLIDGRTVYTPVFSGVYWDQQDTVLEDIERIEVIRGPGATMWGSNAVSGAINVSTKSSRDTQGGLVSAGKGNQENGFASVRYGGEIKKGLTYRAFGKYFDRDEFADATGKEGFDDWNVARGGFRFDWDQSGKTQWTLQGDYYNGEMDTLPATGVVSSFIKPFTENDEFSTHLHGGNVLARWKHTDSGGAKYEFQFYYDRVRRDNKQFASLTPETGVRFPLGLSLKNNDLRYFCLCRSAIFLSYNCRINQKGTESQRSLINRFKNVLARYVEVLPCRAFFMREVRK